MTSASTPGVAVPAAAIDLEIDVPALAGSTEGSRASLEADLAFCHPAIVAVTAVDPVAGRIVVSAALGPGRGRTDRAADQAAGQATDHADLRRAVAEVARLSIASHRLVPDGEPLWHRAPSSPVVPGAGRAALARFGERFLRPLGPGQWALVGPAATLREALDRRFAVIARAAGAEPWHLPSVESSADLVGRVGYLASHGQHVTWGMHLSPRFESLRRFTADARERSTGFPDGHELRPTGFILEPVVCHNVYRALAGARLDRPLAITALGACYRYEGFRFAPLLRQWEFSMREAVLVGDPPSIAARRVALLDATTALCGELDLGATLEIATDPFFVSEAGSARAFQAMQSTKLELRLDLDAGAATAAASFNLHGSHFTAPMDIRDQRGELVTTACVGWGIERWMAAVVARWGDDPAAWPPALTDAELRPQAIPASTPINHKCGPA